MFILGHLLTSLGWVLIDQGTRLIFTWLLVSGAKKYIFLNYDYRA